MKRSTLSGIVLAATIGATALPVASAAAAPPQYEACTKAAKAGKTYTGGYANKTCSEPSAGHEGKYELGTLTAVPATVKEKLGKVDIYLYNPMTKKTEGHFECSKGKGSGTITGASTGEVTFSYSGCKATGSLAGPCNSPGQKAGNVASTALTTRLVWLNEAETEPGIQFKPATEGGPITSVICAGGAETAELVGTMTGQIGPTGEASKNQTLTFGANEVGEADFAGSWEGGTFSSEPLLSNLKGIKEFTGVPSAEGAVFEQKGPAVLIGA